MMVKIAVNFVFRNDIFDAFFPIGISEVRANTLID